MVYQETKLLKLSKLAGKIDFIPNEHLPVQNS